MIAIFREAEHAYANAFRSAVLASDVIWAAWSATGARTNEKDRYMPREIKARLSDLPALPVRVVGMATTAGESPEPDWEKAGPGTITLSIGESPTYIIMHRGG